LGELPTPFLTYLTVESGIFAVVKSVEEHSIEWVHTKKGTINDSAIDFLNKWNGVVLMAETNSNSGEKNFTENRKKEILNNLRIPLLLIGASILTISLFYHNFAADWHYNALLLTKFAGVIICGLLLWQSIDKNNPFIKNLCQSGGKANCNAILSSNAAQVTTWLSWSEVGLFYFAGGFLALLINSHSIFLLWGISAAALFYTFWSIYYQAFVAKQWCTLCLSIQLLFILEFLLNIQFLSELRLNFSKITFSDLSAPLLGAGVAILFWVFLKPFLQKSQQVTPLKNDLKRFKNNPNLFLSLLEKQAEMPFVPTNMHTINFGNPNAEHTLTMVTNTFCQPCAKTHKIIEGLLEGNENLSCRVIFLASNMADDKRGIVAKLVLSLPIHQQAEALHQWYENEERSIEKWQKQLGVIENKNTESTISQHQIWCEMAKIEATPTLFLDGYKMPELYRIGDLKGVLKYLPTTDLQINHK